MNKQKQLEEFEIGDLVSPHPDYNLDYKDAIGLVDYVAPNNEFVCVEWYKNKFQTNGNGDIFFGHGLRVRFEPQKLIKIKQQ